MHTIFRNRSADPPRSSTALAARFSWAALGLAVFAFLPTSAAAQTAPGELLDELRDANIGAAEAFQTVFGADGRLLTITGVFPTGITGSGTAESPTELVHAAAQAAVELVAPAYSRAADAMTEARPDLVWGPVEYVDEMSWMVRATQHHNGVPYLDGELIVVFDNAGNIIAINGTLQRVPNGEQGVPLAASDLAARVENQSAASDDGVDSLSATGSARLVIDARLDGYAWEYVTQNSMYYLDAATQDLYMEISRSQNYNVGSCNVTYLEPNEWTDGSLREFRMSQTPPGTDSSSELCGDTGASGLCIWELSYDCAGCTHRVNRVLDDDGPEVAIVNSCTTPSFTSTTSENIFEQSAYVFTKDSRQRAISHFYNLSSPDESPHDVNVLVRASGTNYSTSTHTIKWNQNEKASPIVVAHEYGHHVVWMYGGLSGAPCINDIFESVAVNETVADTFAHAVGALNYGGDYRAAQLIRGQNVHRDAGSRKDKGDYQCGTDPDHYIGVPFLQASWEVMMNLDCTADSCTTGDSGLKSGSRIWGSVTEYNSILNYTRGLAYALKVTGTSVTFEQIASNMYTKWLGQHGATTANKARSVFQHHGYL